MITTEPASARTNVLAIVALVAALLIPVGYFLSPLLALLVAVVSVVLGHTARYQVKRTGENGRRLALAALVLGWTALVLALLFVVLLVLLLSSLSGLG